MMKLPQNKKFAFSIFDDTDAATLENVKPVYDLLSELGMITTKSVWVYDSIDQSDPNFGSQSLENKNYLEFIKRLAKAGFEIALHNVSADSNMREKTACGFDDFRRLLGFYPVSYANHRNNCDNLYWGSFRLRSNLLKSILRFSKFNVESFGHTKESPYFWGDICKKHIRYVRNFTFREINLLKINPTLPYCDPEKPYVNFWFSSCEGATSKDFNALLSAPNQERLEQEGGVCIVYTHFGKGFVRNGGVNAQTKECLTALAKRRGWFVPVTTLLDYLRDNNGHTAISRSELKHMEWRWFLEKAREKMIEAPKKEMNPR